MAYRRITRTPYRRRPTVKRYTRRTRTIRAPVRRRYTKRRSTVMSKKRLLNITSTKKRDNMLCYTNSTASAQTGGTNYTSNGPAIVTGGRDYNNCAVFLWCATARDNTLNNGATLPRGTTFDTATRTSSTPYMVGLKEAIEIQVNNGIPWQWRRICFTLKGPIGLDTTASFAVALETANGWTRVANQVADGTGGGQQYALYERLFRGQNTSDWNDPMTAKVDTSRVTLKYDKTISIASGNEDGLVRRYNRWHPMKKTLVYNDDELGGTETASAFSTYGKAGMGDYYVVDLFRARNGAATTDLLSFRPEAVLYWHEK